MFGFGAKRLLASSRSREVSASGAPSVAIGGLPTTVGPSGFPGGSAEATVTFSENVTGFEITDITHDPGRVVLADFVPVSGALYTVDLISLGTGDITIQVPAGVAQSVSGSVPNAASAPVTVIFVP